MTAADQYPEPLAMGPDVRINGLLARLEAVLDEENARLGKDASFDLTHMNALKSRCLYDMAILMRDVGPHGFSVGNSKRLANVRKKLEINQRRVKAHMDAVREVTILLKNAATEANADGTYSADQFRAYEF